MSDYTPPLSDIRLIYALSKDTKPGRSTEEWWVIRDAAVAEFDRAIAKVRNEAKAEALREAASELEQLDEIDGKGSYRAGPDNCANWLRARAEKLAT